MQALTVLLFLGLSALTTATTPAPNPVTPAPVLEANELADEVLHQLRKVIVLKALDPIMLPLKSFEFYKKLPFLPIPITGVVKLYDGFLSGISTIHRTGQATIGVITDSDTSDKGNATATYTKKTNYLKTTIGLRDLKGEYTATARFMKFGPKLNVEIGVKSVEIQLKIEQIEGSKDGAQLTEFHVVQLGTVTAVVDGPIGILDWVINKVTNFIIGLVKVVVVDVIEVVLKKKLIIIINKADIPDITQPSSWRTIWDN